MDNRTARRATIILGIVMIVAIGSSALLPLFSNQTATQPTDIPTATVVPTFPPTISDYSSIKFDQDYLHPSGLFSIAQPTGWTISSEPSNPTGVEVTMNNTDLLSVVQASLEVAPQPLQSMDDLDAIYTTASLNTSWSNYRNPRETARTHDASTNKLTIDFEMQNARQQTFLARQVSWWDTDWVYSVRIVTPENQIELLKYMSDQLVSKFKPNRIFAGTAANWNAYFDPTNNFVIRYPSTWQLTDSAPGLPASIDGDIASLRVETLSVSAPLDEAAARSWVEASRPGAAVVSVQPATRGEITGFSVAYAYTDSDGNPNSGLALLLNGANNTLHVANLRIFEANVDLNKDDSQVSHTDLVNILKSFQLLSGLNVPIPTPTPTPTPLPATATSPATDTPIPPTATDTPLPTSTSTPVPPSATPLPPTATDTPAPTATNTPKPTNTAVPPTATTAPEGTPETTP